MSVYDEKSSRYCERIRLGVGVGVRVREVDPNLRGDA